MTRQIIIHLSTLNCVGALFFTPAGTECLEIETSILDIHLFNNKSENQNIELMCVGLTCGRLHEQVDLFTFFLPFIPVQ